MNMMPNAKSRFVPLATAAVLYGILLPGLAHAATYVANWHSGVISSISTAGTVTTFASGLSAPSGLAFDAVGNLFEADEGSGNIFKFTPAGVKSTFATGLNQPYGLTVSFTGEVYVSTVGPGGSAIYKYSADGLTRATLATGATVTSPHGMAVDRNGNLFVANSSHVDKFTPGGVQSQFGTASSGAQGLAFSPSGTLFMTDSQREIYSYNSLGVPTLFGLVPTALGGLAFDAAGTLYVSDRGSTFTDGALYKFDSAGNRTTFVASGLSDPQLGVANALPTPEPSSLVLLGFGVGGLFLRRQRGLLH